MLRLTLLSAVALSIAVCGCNRPPERLVVQHPSADDVADPRCLGKEPAGLTEEQLDSPNVNVLEDQWKARVVTWARTCEGALQRVCTWHVDMGLELPTGLRCEPQS